LTLDKPRSIVEASSGMSDKFRHGVTSVDNEENDPFADQGKYDKIPTCGYCGMPTGDKNSGLNIHCKHCGKKVLNEFISRGPMDSFAHIQVHKSALEIRGTFSDETYALLKEQLSIYDERDLSEMVQR
jgi:hypothetical protein